MLTIDECRGYLSQEVSDSLDDIHLAIVRDELQTLAEIFVEHELERKEDNINTEGIGAPSE